MVRLSGQFPSDTDVVNVFCEIELYGSVSPQRRGLHLSRIGEVLNSASKKTYKSLRDYSIELADRLKQVQDSSVTHVFVKAYYEKTEITPMSKQHSTKIIHLLAETLCDHTSITSKVGINVPYIVACPCTQFNFTKEIAPILERFPLSAEDVNQIIHALPLHNSQSERVRETDNRGCKWNC